MDNFTVPESVAIQINNDKNPKTIYWRIQTRIYTDGLRHNFARGYSDSVELDNSSAANIDFD